jgi:hypothetical protein
MAVSKQTGSILQELSLRLLIVLLLHLSVQSEAQGRVYLTAHPIGRASWIYLPPVYDCWKSGNLLVPM